MKSKLAGWLPLAALAVAAAIPVFLLGQGAQAPPGKGAPGGKGGKGGGKGAPAAPANAKQSAPVDVTGYWVSIVDRKSVV